MYDNVTSINSVTATATMHEDTVKNVLLLSDIILLIYVSK